MNNEDNSNTNIPKRPRWTKPKKISNLHEEIIQMAVLGRSNAYIAKALDFSPQHIARLINSPEISERIKVERETRINSILRDKINGLSGLAIDSLEQVLTSPEVRPSTKLEASKFILEQIVGKASQEIVERKTSLTELIIKIEQMQAEKLRDVSSSQSDSPKVIDPFDTVIDEIIPKNMVIGKRTL